MVVCVNVCTCGGMEAFARSSASVLVLVSESPNWGRVHRHLLVLVIHSLVMSTSDNPTLTKTKEGVGGGVGRWKVNDKRQNSHPSQAKERQRDGIRKGMKGGRKEEEKTTATELCRGFNQPNYSLITETQNLEQLTHTHTHTHT